MLQLSRKLLAPCCSSCMRSIFQLEPSLFASVFCKQVRGKKKKVKLPPTINVRLLKDTRSYGRKGSIVAVLPGRMRNIWLPSRRAEYVTDAQLKALPDVVVERDFSFGLDPTENRQEARSQDADSIRSTRISPLRAVQLLVEHVPELLKFYRTPIPTSPEQDKTESGGEERSPKDATTASASNPAIGSKLMSKQQNAAIYGSVSTGDIATNLQALLDLKMAESHDAARLVISAEDIKIMHGDGPEAAAEMDRIKTLGTFKILIQVKGGEPVQRDILVMEEGESNTIVKKVF